MIPWRPLLGRASSRHEDTILPLDLGPALLGLSGCFASLPFFLSLHTCCCRHIASRYVRTILLKSGAESERMGAAFATATTYSVPRLVVPSPRPLCPLFLVMIKPTYGGVVDRMLLSSRVHGRWSLVAGRWKECAGIREPTALHCRPVLHVLITGNPGKKLRALYDSRLIFRRGVFQVSG
jgi:hypothetical protein